MAKSRRLPPIHPGEILREEMWLGDVEALVGEIEEFLTGTRHEMVSDPILTTILIADVERSTEHLVRLGDASWRDLLSHINQIARRQFETFHGCDPQLVGDQLLALFDGPVRVIRCVPCSAWRLHRGITAGRRTVRLSSARRRSSLGCWPLRRRASIRSCSRHPLMRPGASPLQMRPRRRAPS